MLNLKIKMETIPPVSKLLTLRLICRVHFLIILLWVSKINSLLKKSLSMTDLDMCNDIIHKNVPSSLSDDTHSLDPFYLYFPFENTHNKKIVVIGVVFLLLMIC